MHRYFSKIVPLWNLYNTSTVGWFVFLDDDSLVYMENLVNVAKQYDPMEPWMIGGVSESVTTINSLGQCPFGGGGVLLSRRALQLTSRATNCCLSQYSALRGGDEMLGRCAMDVGVPFTINNGFNQLDLRGDVSGFFEGVISSRPVVTMHHLYLEDAMLLPIKNSFASSSHLIHSYMSLPRKDQYFHRVIQYGHTNRSGLVTVQITSGYSVVVFPGRVRFADITFRVEETFISWSKKPTITMIPKRPKNTGQKRYHQCTACKVAPLCNRWCM
jgi:hypothetical protein